jgi:hypothetical protein
MEVSIGYSLEYALTYIWLLGDDPNEPSRTTSAMAQTAAQADEIVARFYPGATWVRAAGYEYPVGLPS